MVINSQNGQEMEKENVGLEVEDLNCAMLHRGT